MNDEWKSFCRILRKVIDQWSFKSDKYGVSSDELKLRSEIASVIKPYEHQQQLAHTLMHPQPPVIDLPDNKIVVFLEPPASAGQLLVPVLTLKGERHEQRIDVKVVLALFTRDDDDNLRAIAYRFESGDDATHGYFHAQLTEKWCLGGQAGVDDSIPEVVSWFPTSVPAVPVDASKALHAVTSAVISIYGKETTLSILSEHLKPGERKTLEEMKVAASYYLQSS